MKRWTCGFDYPQGFACWLGNAASLCFFSVYIPQLILNFKKKSVEGFSIYSVMFKIIGSSFLWITSYYNGSGLPVFLYGFLNTLQHFLFIIQFWLYSGDVTCLYLTLIPLIPLILTKVFPSSLAYTDIVKPLSQILSQIPLLYKCIKKQTTLGISLFGQHLNLVGAAFGMYMCYILEIESTRTWLIYFNSGFQAISIYIVAIWFHEMRFFDAPPKEPESTGDREPFL